MKDTSSQLPADFWTRSYIDHPKVGRYQQLGLKPELGFGVGSYSLLATLVPSTRGEWCCFALSESLCHNSGTFGAWKKFAFSLM